MIARSTAKNPPNFVFRHELWNSVSFHKNRNKKGGNSNWKKNREISEWKAETHTWKLNWHVSTLTEVFLKQKWINVWEHTVKIVPCDNLGFPFYSYFCINHTLSYHMVSFVLLHVFFILLCIFILLLFPDHGYILPQTSLLVTVTLHQLYSVFT